MKTATLKARQKHSRHLKVVPKQQGKEKPGIAEQAASYLSLVTLHRNHPAFVGAFQSYHNILERPDSSEFRDGKSLVAGLYAIAQRDNRTVRFACQQFIEENHLDWTIQRFYSIVKSIHNRETGAPAERRESKRQAVVSAEKQALASGMGAEQAKAEGKRAEVEHDTKLMINRIRERVSLQTALTEILYGCCKTVEDWHAVIKYANAQIAALQTEKKPVEKKAA